MKNFQKQSEDLQRDYKNLPDKYKNALKKYSTQKDFIVNMNHLSLEKKYEKLMTVADAYNTNFLKLSELEHIYSKDTPILFIESWIIQTANYMKLEINKDQIHELAILFYEDCNFLNIAELTLFFKRVKKGYYGDFYGTFNTWSFMQWAREYRKERGLYVSKIPDNYISPLHIKWLSGERI